ncbi:CASP8 and FADD-like apoptosis regulator a [Stigmatopora nigra]
MDVCHKISFCAPLPASDKPSDMLCIIQEISESLDCDDRSKVLYLCEILNTENTKVRVKETLQSKVMSFDAGNLFLAELMFHLRRYDILRKVLGSSKDEVERALGSRHFLPRFRVLMAHISENMSCEDVDSVKFLLSDMLPRGKIQSFKGFLELITELEILGKISSKRVDFLEECLSAVGRVDLAKQLKMYKMSVNMAITEVTHHHHTSKNPLNRNTVTSEPRGVCLIIDCVGNDGEMLEQAFKSLHFEVTLHKWLGLIDTVSTLRSAFRGGRGHKGDSYVCCVISRATDNHLLATDTNCEGLRLQDVRRLITGAAYPERVGKPKLFFVQSYSVPALQPFERQNRWDDDKWESDGGSQLSSDSTPLDADVLWSHCRTGEEQLRNGQHRSVYLKALAEALSGFQGRSRHMMDVHKEVDRVITKHNSRNPGAEYHIDLKNTLTKDLYL